LAKKQQIDIVVATPGRLIQHWKDESIFLGSLQTIVLDEMDTMLEQGFQRELKEILYPLLYKQEANKETPTKKKTDNDRLQLKEKHPRVVLTSATMTQSIQKLLGDNPKTSKLSVTAKKLHNGGQQQEEQQAQAKLQLPPMKIISAPGLHKAIPRLSQVFVDVGSTDKMALLIDVLASNKKSNDKATIVFCNTAASVQAAQYALSEARIESLAYHGELNSQVRSENLQAFRKQKDGDIQILVCTDLAARGLDIPQVEHVVMFDFPLNAMDYLHRSGRTARGVGGGKVTALVAKRDKVLATAIQNAVVKGEALDGLSSRKSDYLPGAKFGVQRKKENNSRGRSDGRRSDGADRPPKKRVVDTTRKKYKKI
jgi:superfamily II DNA/RNA helicase